MSNIFPPPAATDGQIQSARIEADADAEALRLALAAITTAEALAGAIHLSAYRRSTEIAGDDALGHLSLAADEIRSGLSLLNQIENADLAAELHDARDAARAESRRAE